MQQKKKKIKQRKGEGETNVENQKKKLLKFEIY